MDLISSMTFLIAEDNLLQLKSIQDQIQKLRVENAKQAAADPPYPTSSRTGLLNLGLHMHQNSAARLSTSCPSLNNSLSRIGSMAVGPPAIPINENNNYGDQGRSFDMNSNYNSQSTAGPTSITPGHPNRRRKNNDPSNPGGTSQPGGSLAVPISKGHRKRQGHHRQRRYNLRGNGTSVVPACRVDLFLKGVEIKGSLLE